MEVWPTQQGSPPAERRTTEARILAVDDTPENLLALRALLEPLGHQIITADSGEKALSLAAESEFALVLLDVMMPRMDGFETLRRLRELPSFDGTPVLLLSAYDPPPKMQEHAYRMGALDYLFKPIEPDVLRAKVDVYTSLYRRGVELQRWRASLAAKDRYIAILAHDLRSPLTAIKTTAETQARGETSPRICSQAARILRVVMRMERMTQELLDFARAGTGGMPVAPVDMDLATLSRESVDEVAAAHPERALNLETEGNLEGRWDRERVHQALSNLLGNAIQYGRGKIAVRARRLPGRVEVAVWNGGDSIPSDQIARIFEPFERGQQGGTGIGLGLYIVREIAQSHGGAVSVESAPATGTTFTLSLPISDTASISTDVPVQ